MCSSGDCQWPDFSSLAVCAAVADVSDRLTITQTNMSGGGGGGGGVSLPVPNKTQLLYKAALPNGAFLLGDASTWNLNISSPGAPQSSSSTSGDENEDDDDDHDGNFLPAQTSLAFSSQDGRVLSGIANLFFVYTNTTSVTNQTSSRNSSSTSTGQRDIFRAAEVLLHFCVNTYQVSTRRGISISTVVHSSALTVLQQQGGVTTAGTILSSGPDTSSSPDTISSSVGRRAVSDTPGVAVATLSLSTSTAAGGEENLQLQPLQQQQQQQQVGVYTVKRDDVELLSRYIRGVFAGSYSHRYGSATGSETAVSEAIGTALFDRGTLSESMMLETVRNVSANVATSLTNTQVSCLFFIIVFLCFI